MQLIGPVTSADFKQEDFAALEKYELQKRVNPVIDVLKTFYSDLEEKSRYVVRSLCNLTFSESLAALISTASSIVASSYMPTGSEGVFMAPQSPRSRAHEQLDNGEM